MRDKVEADLSQYHHLRLSDLWRFDEDGCRRLTLREVWVRLRRLPGESALVTHFNGGRPRWDDETYLLADLIHVMSGKPHPARPKPVKVKPSDASRREQIKRQYRQRKRIPAGRKTP